MAKISIIIPCYNNEANIPMTAPALFACEKLYPSKTVFEYVFVDDGSTDRTYEALKTLHMKYPQKVIVVKLLRNFGSNNASLAGLTLASGDCIGLCAADLQDPPRLLPKLFLLWQKGATLSVANRRSRQDRTGMTLFSDLFHVLVRMLFVPHAPKGGFDMCVFDKKLRDEILVLNPKHFFLPYLLVWLCHNVVSIPYTRRTRTIGKSGWTLKKRIGAVVDTFFFFSPKPIQKLVNVFYHDPAYEIENILT